MSATLLKQIATDIEVISRDNYRVCDAVRAFPDYVRSTALRREHWEIAAGDALGRFIYDSYYLGIHPPNGGGRSKERPTSVQRMEDEAFGRELRAANAGAGWQNDGWEVVGQEQGRHLVRKDGLTLYAREEELCGGPDEGGKVAVGFPKHLPYVSPGFYTAIADAGPTRNLVRRVYINVSPEGAPPLLGALTSCVNSLGLRSLIKVLNHPAQFGRPDACVAYLEHDGFNAAHRELEEVIRGYSRFLSDRIPGFTWRWMAGVGVAEDPITSSEAPRSFGEHRSLLVGRGLALAFSPAESGRTGLERLEVITTYLLQQELDPERLYLNPGSAGLLPSSL